MTLICEGSSAAFQKSQALISKKRQSAHDVQETQVRVGIGDRAIRTALKRRLIAEQPNAHIDTILFEELGLCRGLVRADIAVVNGSLHGYEIKSDLDSLRRLQNQIDVYGRVLDYATLVVGERLFDEAVKVIPEWWGVLHAHTVADDLEFETIRNSGLNPGRDPRALAELLWFEDAVDLLGRFDALTGVRRKPRRILWDRISERISIEDIAAAVRGALKSRVRCQAVLQPSKCDASYQGVATLPGSQSLERDPLPS